MENQYVVPGLIRKRAELAGKLQIAQKTVHELITNIGNIDAAILIFNPDADLAAIKPKPVPPRFQAYKGDTSRTVFSALRDSNKPMTTLDLTHHVMAERGLDINDKTI